MSQYLDGYCVCEESCIASQVHATYNQRLHRLGPPAYLAIWLCIRPLLHITHQYITLCLHVKLLMLIAFCSPTPNQMSATKPHVKITSASSPANITVAVAAIFSVTVIPVTPSLSTKMRITTLTVPKYGLASTATPITCGGRLLARAAPTARARKSRSLPL